MPRSTQNKGPCAIIDCKSTADTDKFRRITDVALEKLCESPNCEDFNFLKLGDQLCFSHYMKCVEPAKRRRLEKKSYNKDKDNNEMEDVETKSYNEDKDNNEMEDVDNNLFLRGVNVNI